MKHKKSALPMQRGMRHLGPPQPGKPHANPAGCLHLPLHPFLSPLRAGRSMSTLPPLARRCFIAPQPPSPAAPGRAPGWGIAAASSRLVWQQPRQAAPTSRRADLARRPSVFREQGPPPRSTCSPSKATRGSWKMRTFRGRRDLRPRNCLARFALYEGGEYPREHSAHAFPCSWKSVAVCIGRVVFVVWGYFFLFFIFPFLN